MGGNAVYRFGPFRFEPGESRLLHDGRAVPLPPKAIETLLALVERGGSLVGKRELMDRVWPGCFVEENSLDKCISTLRKALDDRRVGPSYIETVPKRGYRFVAEVRRGGTGGDRRELLRRSTRDPHAYRLYREARHHALRYSSSGWQRCAARFEQAIDLDPSFALAHADLAIASALASVYFTADAEVGQRARQAARRALAIDPELAEAHLANALVGVLLDWDWEGADAAFRRALELDPEQAWVHDYFGLFLALVGQSREALRAVEKAVELHPVRLTMSGEMGLVHLFTGDLERALDHHRRALELDPFCVLRRVDLARTCQRAGRHDEAAAELEATLRVDHAPWVRVWLGRAHALAGRHEEARRILEELYREAHRAPLSPVFPAIVHAALGERRAAIDLLQVARVERSPWIAFLGVDPGFDELRDETAFTALVRRVGLPR